MRSLAAVTDFPVIPRSGHLDKAPSDVPTRVGRGRTFHGRYRVATPSHSLTWPRIPGTVQKQVWSLADFAASAAHRRFPLQPICFLAPRA